MSTKSILFAVAFAMWMAMDTTHGDLSNLNLQCFHLGYQTNRMAMIQTIQNALWMNMASCKI